SWPSPVRRCATWSRSMADGPSPRRPPGGGGGGCSAGDPSQGLCPRGALVGDYVAPALYGWSALDQLPPLSTEESWISLVSCNWTPKVGTTSVTFLSASATAGAASAPDDPTGSSAPCRAGRRIAASRPDRPSSARRRRCSESARTPRA